MNQVVDEGSLKRFQKSRFQIYSNPLPLKRSISLTSYIAGLLLSSSPLNIIPWSAYLDKSVVGEYDISSNSVLVKSTGNEDNKSIKILWERGFFGKGNLSRSEPTWSSRVEQLDKQQQRGDGNRVLTAEELTKQRRKDRSKMKKDKAKLKETQQQDSLRKPPEQEEIRNEPLHPNEQTEQSTTVILTQSKEVDGIIEKRKSIVEHLQLDPQEAFFLLFSLGAIDIYNDDSPYSTPMTIEEAWITFMSYYKQNDTSCNHQLSTPLQFNNPFLINYVVYHHYRSLGFVPRSGIKFGVDWVIYKGSDGSGKSGAGPIGGHAEFAVITVPVRNEMDKDSANCYLSQDGCSSWRSLSTINRVVSGVKKTLVLAYVALPETDNKDILRTPDCIKHYKVSEIVIRRFAPTRLRD